MFSRNFHYGLAIIIIKSFSLMANVPIPVQGDPSAVVERFGSVSKAVVGRLGFGNAKNDEAEVQTNYCYKKLNLLENGRPLVGQEHLCPTIFDQIF